MKHAIISVLSGVFAIAFAMPADAQTMVTIGTSNDPNNGAQIVIAREKGFFRDAGLDADIKFFPSGGDLMSAFVGGSIQYGSSGTIPVLTIRSRPFPIKVIAQMSDISGAQQVIVKKSVNSLDELRGKKIGVMRGTASEALYNSVIKGYNFDPGSAEIINMDPTVMNATFIRGDVDAIVLWEPQSTKARKLGGGKTLISGTHSYTGVKPVEKRVYGDHAVLFANDTTLKGQPAVARSIIVALQKATDFIQSNRSEATTILSKEYGLEPSDIEGILDVNRYTLRVDDQLVGDMDKLAAFLVTSRRIKNAVNVKDMIDTGVLKSVRLDLVSVPY